MKTGQLIDNRYRIVEKLGEGGMGAVWKAIDVNHDDEVVIKMPLNHLDEDIRRRFAREARSMRKHSIECPQILNIEDIGSEGDTPWYVMRYLGGGSICDRPLPVNDDGTITWDVTSFDWLKKIASALDYLHDQNCFHRDVKPENILYSTEGTPYLVDFGIVKTVNETTSMMTEQGKTVGTMAYMAPEILDGGTYTPQSDQYSLAVTLYEFLTGDRPFSGTTFFSLFRSIQKGHRQLSELHPVIPLAASQSVDRALDQEPEERFPTCSSFVDSFVVGMENSGVPKPATKGPTDFLVTSGPEKIKLDETEQDLESEPKTTRHPIVAGGSSDADRIDNQQPTPKATRSTVSQYWPLAAMIFVILSATGLAWASGFFGNEPAVSDNSDETRPTVTSTLQVSDGSDVRSSFSEPTPKSKTPAELFESAEELFANGEGSSNDRTLAIEQYSSAALDGHLQSQKRLGEIYSEGQGVEQDFKEAFDWLRLAADQNDATSQFLVGLSYAKGDIGVEKDSQEAVHWFKKAADQDLPEAQLALGMQYFRGEGVEKDLNEAQKYLKRSAANDFAPAEQALQLVAAEIEANKPKPLTKLEKLQLAASKGDADSQFELAKAHETGNMGLRKSSRSALKFYIKAAENDHLESQLLLANRYDKGSTRTRPSYDDARKWYLRAARQGNSMAKNRAAELKNQGSETGFLARKGDAESQFDYGEMFADGDGVKKNIKEAMKWYRKSAEQGNSSAQFAMGFNLQNGAIGESDYAQAVKWYLKAAKQGNRWAQYNLAGIYEAGTFDVEQDTKEAIRWYRSAATLGDSDAKDRLNEMLPKSVTSSIGMRFIRINDGKFRMGSPQSEKERNADETLHRVEVKRDLYVARHEVTVKQFRQFVQETGHQTSGEKSGGGSSSLDPLSGEIQIIPGTNWQNPGYPTADNLPVTQVSWDDANKFAIWLGKKDDRKYRLPTEAEWEYAARAGTQTRYSSGDSYASLDGYANVADQSRSNLISPDDRDQLAPFNDGHEYLSPVGSFRPNKFGLYDMHGNVWEWCYDTYDAKFYSNSKKTNPFSKKYNDLRIMRGGCFL